MITFFENSKRSFIKFKLPKKVRYILYFLAFLVVFFSYPTFSLYRACSQTLVSIDKVVDSVKSQDIETLSNNLPLLKNDFNNMKSKLKFFVFFKPIPFLGSYYNDASYLVEAGIKATGLMEDIVAILKPDAVELGLTSASPGDAGKRLPLLVKVLEKLIPRLDQIAPTVSEINFQLNRVSAEHYPEFGSFKLRSKIKLAKNIAEGANNLLTTSRPALEVLPSVMGVKEVKTYLLLFQNDKELRPSGGFLTAYTYITLDKGNLTTTGTDDIYTLDERINKVCLKKICDLKPPDPIVKYLPEPTGKPKQAIESRDSNISPDWYVSAKEFERFYSIAGGKPIDGIIAVDTELVKSLLGVVGEISVTGYETQFNKDNIVNELLGYANVVFAGQPGRKTFLGDVMNAILQSILQSPKDKLFNIGEVIIRSLNEKHVLLYFHDQKAQEAAESLNWAGRIKEYSNDYLLIVDSNFAGGKSNLFIQEEVSQTIEISKDGKITKTVNILYKNPEKYHPRLNPGYRDWVRIFVPLGSKLVSSEGSQVEVITSQDLGKTVFEAFHVVKPQSSSQLSFKYTLPFTVSKNGYYQLMIQKQAGIPAFNHSIEVNNKKTVKNFKLSTDKEFKFDI